MSIVYDNFFEFIASGPPVEAVANWQLSDKAKAHVADLVLAEREGRITADDQEELRHVLEFEHLMRLEKAHARVGQR